MPNGTVKWFNASKGFGFIEPETGGEDVFVHVSALERAGLSGLGEGQQVRYELEPDRRTGKMSAGGLELIGPAVAAPARRDSFEGRAFGGGGRPPRPERSFESRGGGGGGGRSGVGTVKWFNTTKGFGFIAPSEGGADVFVHISAVERSGLGALQEGQTISYELEKDRRTGKEAATNLKLAR